MTDFKILFPPPVC